MQKVEGSSPFIRFVREARTCGPLAFSGPPCPGAKNLVAGATFRSMTHDPSSQTGNSDKARPDERGAGGEVTDAVERLATRVDDETWLTLGAAIGQLSSIHDPIPRAD